MPKSRYCETSEISFHEVRFFRAISTTRWQTHSQIARVSGLTRRYVNSMTKKYLALNLIDLAEVFPAHLYRLSKLASKRNPAYLERLRRTDRVFKQFDKNQKRVGPITELEIQAVKTPHRRTKKYAR